MKKKRRKKDKNRLRKKMQRKPPKRSVDAEASLPLRLELSSFTERLF